MRPRERVIRALELEEPDTVPTFEMIIDPVDTVRAILGREPIYENTKGLLEMQARGDISEEKIEWVNGQWVRGQYVLYCKLDLDMIRFWEWRFSPAKSIEKMSDEEWVIEGGQICLQGWDALDEGSGGGSRVEGAEGRPRVGEGARQGVDREGST